MLDSVVDPLLKALVCALGLWLSHHALTVEWDHVREASRREGISEEDLRRARRNLFAIWFGLTAALAWGLAEAIVQVWVVLAARGAA
ncbi:MAG TPA: hypothetical protein VGC13_04335 [Longimicrobium sp.]|uniref:hypothetical protein n=1 Tax=Longimicrobium sp. TaxID=2029185 RepID=UPI002ED985E5